MIASVRGEVLVRRPDHVVVECAGVGYRLGVSAETLKAVPASGREVVLHARLVVRDDSIALYGFASEQERELFCQLTSVSGIGPKVAIAILSGGTPRELVSAIAGGDAKRFQAVPGIGKRTSERVIVELRERLADELEQAIGAPTAGGEDSPRGLAREGLLHLGYTLSEAEKLLEGAAGETPEDLIGSALRAAGSREAA